MGYGLLVNYLDLVSKWIFCWGFLVVYNPVDLTRNGSQNLPWPIYLGAQFQYPTMVIGPRKR